MGFSLFSTVSSHRPSQVLASSLLLYHSKPVYLAQWPLLLLCCRNHQVDFALWSNWAGFHSKLTYKIFVLVPWRKLRIEFLIKGFLFAEIDTDQTQWFPMNLYAVYQFISICCWVYCGTIITGSHGFCFLFLSVQSISCWTQPKCCWSSIHHDH